MIKESRQIVPIGGGFIINGAWGTGKRSTADETLSYLKRVLHHILVVSIDNPDGLEDDITFLEKIFLQLSDPELLGTTLSPQHTLKYVNEYNILLDEINTSEPELYNTLIEDETYLSLEKLAAKQSETLHSNKSSSLQASIKSHFDRLNDQNILIQKQQNLFISFVKDLFVALFPIDPDFPSLEHYKRKLEAGTLPVRIVFNISKCEVIMGGIFSLLVDVFAHLNKTLTVQDLDIPALSDSAEKLLISDFIQFIPLISLSSRISELPSPEFSLINKEYLNKESVQTLVKGFGLDPDTTLERTWHLYGGHPRLTNWHLSLLNDGIKEKDFIDGLGTFTDSAFCYLSDQEKYLIFALAVFGGIDKRALSIITGAKDNYWYNVLANYYFVQSDNQRLSLKKPFRILASYLPYDTNTIAQLENIAETYTGIAHELHRFPDEDLDKLRLLAFFDRFNPTFLREAKVSGELPFIEIDELIKIYDDIFLKNQNSYSIEPNIRLVFNQYNTLFSDYENLKKLPSLLWDNYVKSLTNQRLNIERERKLRTEELRSIDAKVRKLKKQESTSKEDLSHTRQELVKIKNELGQFADKKNDKLAFSFLTIGILSLVLYFMSSWFFSNFFEHDETIGFASWLLLIIAIICLVLSSKLIYRIIMGFAMKDDIDKKRQIRVRYEDDLVKRTNTSNQISADIKAANDKINELNKDVANILKEQEEIDNRLHEPFIDKV